MDVKTGVVWFELKAFPPPSVDVMFNSIDYCMGMLWSNKGVALTPTLPPKYKCCSDTSAALCGWLWLVVIGCDWL